MLLDHATCKVNENVNFSDGGFRPVIPRKTKKAGQQSEVSRVPVSDKGVDAADEEVESSCHEDEIETDKLFACPNEGCIKVYQRYGSMVNHTMFGRCEYKPESQTMSLLDNAKLKYSQKLMSGMANMRISNAEVSASNHSFTTTGLKQGWALKTTKTSKHFSDRQKKFLEEKFMLGETTGKKSDPNTVAKQMRAARGADGERLFSSEEYLSATQIQGFFARRAKSLKKGNLEDNDYEAAEVEETFMSIRDEVLEETELCHPIIYDGYNLCELAAGNKLSKCTLAVLKEICSYFELDVHTTNTRYKAPYIKSLDELIQTCSCSKIRKTKE